MKNKEFFKEEIFEIACNGNSVGIVNGEPVACGSIACGKCDVDMHHECEDYVKEWMEQEHEEPRIQPEVKKMKKDDRVLVSIDGVNWLKMHFKMYNEENDAVYTYCCGCTSWTAAGDNASEWTYAKLPKDNGKEIDWSKVPVDTKIWVKNSHDPIWIPRHFAEYKHGKVYAWLKGKTSFTTSEERSWDCAKLTKIERGLTQELMKGE